MDLELVDPFQAPDTVEALWKQLNDRNEQSYFQSWGWIENWLACLPKNVSLKLAVLRDGSARVACFFIGNTKRYRHGFIRSNGAYLNCTGDPVFDAVWVEYNCIGGLTGSTVNVHELLDTIRGDCNELHLPYLDCSLFPGKELTGPTAPYGQIVEKFVSPYVDLAVAGTTLDSYLARLTSKTRYNVRRSLRLYEQQGAVGVEAAADVNAAEEYFDQLVRLNVQEWRRRKRKSAFESEFFVRFHKRLIEKNFLKGEIQLLKIGRKDEAIGYLYNFVWAGKVYSYQCAFKSYSDNRLKPGIVSHVKAVLLNAQLGHVAYDFLAGPERYKSALSTHQNGMVSVICKKPSVTYWIEKTLLPSVKAALRKKEEGAPHTAAGPIQKASRRRRTAPPPTRRSVPAPASTILSASGRSTPSAVKNDRPTMSISAVGGYPEPSEALE